MPLIQYRAPSAETTATPDIEVLGLLHAAWREWRKIRGHVYRSLGVRNTEELIRWVMDLRTCRPIEHRLGKFIEALREIIGKLDAANRLVEEAEKILSSGVAIIPFFSAEYPRELLRYRTGSDYLYPPLVLYAKNLRFDLNSRPIIAIVGTRRCTQWGRAAAHEAGRTIARRGAILATGLAEGIDTAASHGALEAGAPIAGVRPWIAPLTLPAESRALLEKFQDRIAVISENHSKPAPASRRLLNTLYYLRNRIIAGMSKVVIVIEARDAPHSGSMHQIELALRRGKPVIILEHPEKESPYWKAFEKYASKGAIIAKSAEEAAEKALELAS